MVARGTCASWNAASWMRRRAPSAVRGCRAPVAPWDWPPDQAVSPIADKTKRLCSRADVGGVRHE